MERRVAMRGELGTTSLANLLSTVEQTNGDAEVRLFTELGVGHVWFSSGSLADAELGGVTGEAALGRLMVAEEGRFEVLQGAGARPRRIASTVRQVLQRQAARAAEWSQLLEQAPNPRARLWRSDAGEAAATLPADSRALLSLCNGERSLTDVIDASGCDAVEALRRLVALLDAGHLQAGPSPSLLPFSTEPADPALSIALPGAPRVPRVEPLHATRIDGYTPPPPQDDEVSTRYSSRPGRVEVVAVRRPSSRSPTSLGATSPYPARDDERTGPSTERMAPVDRPALTLRDGSWEGRPLPTAPEEGVPEERPPSRLRPDAHQSDERFVGRYEVLGRLGRGGMGAVYLCRVTGEAGFRRLFALKVLRHRLRPEAAAEQSFLREAYVASRLHHPNAVAVVDAAIHARQPYLVLEYVEGCSLGTLLHRSPDRRPPGLIAAIVADALEGLAAAHALVDDEGRPLRLVHGDVSPENLLVGADGIARMSDFGVSRLGNAGIIHHASGPLLGRPGYVAPEQARGQPYGQSADLFSMGVVLWNALTGRELFAGATPNETLDALLSAPIPPPSSVGLRPPACFDALCLAALERDPRRRLTSAQEMADELRGLIVRHQLHAPRVEVANWVRHLFRRELEQRRLAILDAARGTGGGRRLDEPSLPRAVSIPPTPCTPVAHRPEATGAAPIATAPRARGEVAHGIDAGEPAVINAVHAETGPTTQRRPSIAPADGGNGSDGPAPEQALRRSVLRNGGVIVSALLAVGVILVSILRPQTFAGWFEMDVGGQGLVALPPSAAPTASEAQPPAGSSSAAAATASASAALPASAPPPARTLPPAAPPKAPATVPPRPRPTAPATVAPRLSASPGDSEAPPRGGPAESEPYGTEPGTPTSE